MNQLGPLFLIPDRTRIGPYLVEIKFCDPEEMPDLHGDTKMLQDRILIRLNSSDYGAVLLDTFWHEILEAIAIVRDLKKMNHQTIQTIGADLAQIVMDAEYDEPKESTLPSSPSNDQSSGRSSISASDRDETPLYALYPSAPWISE